MYIVVSTTTKYIINNIKQIILQNSIRGRIVDADGCLKSLP